jgi:hypothetical protein
MKLTAAKDAKHGFHRLALAGYAIIPIAGVGAMSAASGHIKANGIDNYFDPSDPNPVKSARSAQREKRRAQQLSDDLDAMKRGYVDAHHESLDRAGRVREADRYAQRVQKERAGVEMAPHQSTHYGDQPAKGKRR